MNSFVQGINLSLLGIGITFSALGVLILVILLLRWLFPVRQKIGGNEVIADGMKNENETEAVVAIAAAWQYLQAKKGGQTLGERLEHPRGPWWYKSEDKD